MWNLMYKDSCIAMATKTWNLYIVDLTQVCSCLDILHCSLRANDLTDTGAITLARSLQHNKSLEELKWVVDWVSCYQEMWGLKNTYLHTIDCGRFLPCILPPTVLIHSDWLTFYTTCTNSRVLSSTVLNPIELEILEPLHWLMLWEWTRAWKHLSK